MIKLKDIKMLPQHPGSGNLLSHELESERFQKILKNIPPSEEKMVMIELGCFWSLWSIIFGKTFNNHKVIVIDGDIDKLNVGVKNLTNNDINFNYYNNTIYSETSEFTFNDNIENISINFLMESEKIKKAHVIHMDIQGSEISLYDEMFEKLSLNIVENVVIATHSENIHNEILNKMKKLNSHTISDIPFKKGKYDGEIIVQKKY